MERQDVAESEVEPGMANLSGRLFSESWRGLLAIVGWNFYVQDVRYLAVPWMARSLFGSVSFFRKKK